MKILTKEAILAYTANVLLGRNGDARIPDSGLPSVFTNNTIAYPDNTSSTTGYTYRWLTPGF
ncbi:hypothetical protein D9756_008129 [Leucocoprinus leucothites]|uniref:Uncharacterized protein n=1 Tax=Leucocoprinus leucothites TaxID=201217 RepID=A0A8H5D4P9_9AGAR|nr:hypothetical protein D9756_008129 [Leucoagaricus leucothites]